MKHNKETYAARIYPLKRFRTSGVYSLRNSAFLAP